MNEINLNLGDCMEAMSKMEDNAYDLAIVDPPYGIGAAKMSMGSGSCLDTGKVKKKNWDSCAPNSEYFEQLKRVSKNQIIWGANHYIDNISFSCSSSCWVVWDKKDYNSDFADGEMAWTSFKSVFKIYQRARSTGGDQKNKIHPTQKPVALYKWLLKNYAKEGDKILDTHLGSGSIAIACHDGGWSLDAWEIDAEYHKKATERYEKHIQQMRMF
jgi:site-specific DNA-methyltransferase (adenine-specific)